MYSRRIHHAISRTPAPVLLHACHESRLVTMKYYKLLFNEHYLTPRIWIKPKSDTLYLCEEVSARHSIFNCFETTERGSSCPGGQRSLYCNYLPTILKNLQPNLWDNLSHIALNSTIKSILPFQDDAGSSSSTKCVETFTKFTKLKTLSIVFEALPKRRGHVVLVDPPVPHWKCNHQTVRFPFKSKCEICSEATNIDRRRKLRPDDSSWWIRDLQSEFLKISHTRTVQHVVKLNFLFGVRV